MKIKRIDLKNYRSVEDTSIIFEDYYTAICGKNNSGKSNIIRAILNILNRASFIERLNYNTDYPIWKNKTKDDFIQIRLYLSLSASTDYGLIKFLKIFSNNNKDSNLVEVKDTELIISQRISAKHRDSFTEIIIDGSKVEDKYRVSEIIRKIQTTQIVIFHNSTQIDRRLRKNSHGYIDNIQTKTKENIEGKLKLIHKELSKAVDKHKKELQTLIGRLEEKYEVGLSFSGFEMNIDQVPYEIYLGEKNYELPLEDWGSGTKNRTLILTSIFNAKNQIDTDDESSKVTPIILIEEPESFLHPLAQAEFGRILQDLSKELEIQVIATTHSPYLLSHHNPKSNILVKRKLIRGKYRETFVDKVDENNWKEPFELALGMVGPEFETLKNAFFSSEKSLLLVEGDIDKEYFEILKNNIHQQNKLNFEGEIFSYEGFGFLTNNILLKFIKNRFNKVFITLDLDTYDKVKGNLEKTGFEKDKTYFVVGLDLPGKRNIEGLLPSSVTSNVHLENSDLVQALLSENKDEVSTAKSKLKKLYLEKFKQIPITDLSCYEEFYKLTNKLNKAFRL